MGGEKTTGYQMVKTNEHGQDQLDSWRHGENGNGHHEKIIKIKWNKWSKYQEKF